MCQLRNVIKLRRRAWHLTPVIFQLKETMSQCKSDSRIRQKGLKVLKVVQGNVYIWIGESFQPYYLSGHLGHGLVWI